MTRELFARSTKNEQFHEIMCVLLSPRNSLRDIFDALDFFGAMRVELHDATEKEVNKHTHGCD